MNEMLTISEIEDRFGEQWVLIQDPVFDRDGEVIKGRVLYHSHDRDEFDRRSLDFRVPHAAVLYTGEMPADLAVVL